MRPLSLAGPKIHRLNNNVMISSQGRQERTVDISAQADLKMTSLTRKILYEMDNKTSIVQLKAKT